MKLHKAPKIEKLPTVSSTSLIRKPVPVRSGINKVIHPIKRFKFLVKIYAFILKIF